ncbi:DUF1816 domain-containing protein [Waterburya agarophytonicola K14]|uniref:DUF1816 domain-containing protein n=1 Tax=Waterburya agarophytonicola KI4 TaxID=2874699 RepID=A0A964FH85_9CYAN|nr:DUF1816 domain-containing protein [Waterburya agarophytonicola]MCC0177253.1 DUF1816 domain-containing protein [Waterburya agarophytonicola KI4]
MSLATKLIGLLGLRKKDQVPYWLRISTKVPQCIYYFGPFDSPLEAKGSQAGYIEDLMEEEALGIHVELEQCWQPPELTICEEELF